MSNDILSTISSFFRNFFSFFVTDTADVIYICLIAILFVYVIYLHLKVHKFTRGQNGESLEKIIETIVNHSERIQEENVLIKNHAQSLDTRVAHSLRNAQIVRYKALETSGSNQSFSLALLNEEGNGIVLTSLHVRDRINTFAKPIEKYKSSFDLTEEEVQVINDAKSAHRK